MKKTTNTFTFNFNTNGQKKTTVLLPKKFEDIFNELATTTDSSNSIHELSCFCDEYAKLSPDEQVAFQEAIASGHLELWLNNFKDLRALVKSIGIPIV